MKTVRELLREADPLRYEQMPDYEQRRLQRQALLAAASAADRAGSMRLWPRLAVVVVVLMAIAAAVFGIRGLSGTVGEVHAAVRFEARLAEDQPGPGLQAVKLSESGRTVYLHQEVLVNNSDIAAAQVIPGSGPSAYGVEVKFKATGSAKIHAATEKHIGKPLAILLDGAVAAVPVVRTPIDTSAVISGNFTRAEAERIVSGIGAR
jgi:hypothetical protein